MPGAWPFSHFSPCPLIHGAVSQAQANRQQQRRWRRPDSRSGLQVPLCFRLATSSSGSQVPVPFKMFGSHSHGSSRGDLSGPCLHSVARPRGGHLALRLASTVHKCGASIVTPSTEVGLQMPFFFKLATLPQAHKCLRPSRRSGHIRAALLVATSQGSAHTQLPDLAGVHLALRLAPTMRVLGTSISSFSVDSTAGATWHVRSIFLPHSFCFVWSLATRSGGFECGPLCSTLLLGFCSSTLLPACWALSSITSLRLNSFNMCFTAVKPPEPYCLAILHCISRYGRGGQPTHTKRLR